MEITFYNVTPHPTPYLSRIQSISQRAILPAFIAAIRRRHRRLIVTIADDKRSGKICFKSGQIVSFFDID